MLVRMQDVLPRARERGYALGAFNTYNLEITAAIVGAAEAQGAPVIVQTGAGALGGKAREALPALVLAMARAASVPVVVHLDHSTSMEQVERHLALGYTSVMFDGSALPYERNSESTREAALLGHAAGVLVEAELAGLPGSEDDAAVPGRRPATFTEPALAERFAAETGIDLLAISIGNVHGFYSGEPHIDFDVLAELRAAVPLPLVLHGASGLSDDVVRRAVEGGICKVNFNTEMRVAYFAALVAYLDGEHAGHDMPALMRAGVAAVQRVVEAKLVLLGSAGQARQ